MVEKNGHGDMDLVPVAPPDVEIEALLWDGEPPLVDVDALDYTRLQVYQRQELVLKGYVRFGTTLKAAEYAGVHRDCTYVWRKNSTLNWNGRWLRAVDMRREFAEQKYVIARLDNPEGNRGPMF